MDSDPGSPPDSPPRHRPYFRDPASVNRRPPIHRRRSSPGIHIGRNANENFGSIGAELAQGLGKDPIVTDCRAYITYGRLCNREEFLIIAIEVMGAGVDFPGDPGIDFAIFVPQSFRANQAGCVEYFARPFGIFFQKSSRLNINAQLLGFDLVAGGVLVGDGNGEFGQEPFGRRINRRGVSELGKGEPLNIHQGAIALNRHVNHGDHAIYIPIYFVAVLWVRMIYLTGSHTIAQAFIPHLLLPSLSSTLCAPPDAL